MKNTNFKKTYLATSMSILLGSALALPTFAQQQSEENDGAENVEVIAVSGIKGSLLRSADLKRTSDGVVDAISAEEMGKFPDTNLAESLGRITGVSISRANGEGSQITVRGFGPGFNLVTLNGRQMAGTGFTRSFNFENLSSEGVSALEVYKTARADKPTGGIGATVNIVTNRPLSNPGQRFSVMAKGIHDTSNEVNDDVTPEIAGIYSNTFADERFGVSASFSYQRRDFQSQSARVQGWKAQTSATYLDDDGVERPIINAAPLPAGLANSVDGRTLDAEGNAVPLYRVVNPQTGEIVQTAAHFLPQDLNYGIQNVQRERTNAQLTLQYAATEDLTFTLDHTLSRAVQGNEGLGWGIWNGSFGGNANAYELDENGTALFYNSAGNDQSFTTNRVTNEVDSYATGLNAQYFFSDTLSFEFDVHTSTSKTDNTLDDGLGHDGLMILGTNAFRDKSYDFRNGEVPSFVVNWLEGDEVSPANIGANLGIFSASPGESEVNSARFSGEWMLDTNFGLKDLKFGVEYTEQTLTGSSAVSQPAGYNFNTAVFPDSMFERVSLDGFLDEFDFGPDGISPNYTYTYDFAEAVARSIAFFDETNPIGNTFDIDNYINQGNSEVNEETIAAYLSSSWEFEIKDYYLDLNFGLRYEQTDVTSPGETQVIERVVWNGGSEWRTIFAGDVLTVDFEGDYNLLLPMLDLRMDVTDELVARFSTGQTITRPELGQLLGGLTRTGFPAIGARTGARGNPGLLPFKSTNLDLSLEYYYDEASYASVGLFWKDVDDWIDTTQVIQQYEGVHDIFRGERWNAAEAAIQARGEQATDDAIYAEIIAAGVGVDGTTVLPDPSSDPLIDWTITSPENVGTRKTNGVELAVQHLFGETGFGVGVNATLVDGDVDYDRYLLAAQAVLPGLSDSANFQIFYEDDALSVKLTANWRDEYLVGQGQAQGSSDVPPQFAEEFTQVDLSVNYNLTENITVFFEGVNLTNETERVNGRFTEQFLSAAQFGPRYAIGIRYAMN
uniref:TonB-dependent receptor n=1 Tax=Ningiella ruwaisensis TaxID=2364274 RepID=UPI0010A0C280|nr:TonB-dependent receptor [Ningiella ruwaisensis]